MKLFIFIMLSCYLSIISGQNLNTEISDYIVQKKYNKAQNLCSKETAQLDEQTFIKCGHAYEFDKNEINAAKFYDLGLKKYPNSFQIRYEKAILFLNNNKDYEASITLLPLLQHYKDNILLHNAIGRIEYNQNRTAALMALIMSEFLDPDSKYSQQNIISIKELFKRKAFVKTSSSSENKMSLHNTYNSSGTQKKLSKINDFNHTDFILSTQSIVGNFDIKDEIKLLTKQFDFLGISLKETNHLKKGEYWTFYAPIFIKIQENNLSETAAYYLLKDKNSAYQKWLEKHHTKTKSLEKIISSQL
ncbi:MAG: tetratricopeptide repeat protein [Flavobacteriales bacterium]